MSRYVRTQTDVVDAIQITFGTIREKIRAFDKHIEVSLDWDGWERWIMLPSGEREFCYGDWIVRNEAGRLFFCDPETFAADYTLEVFPATFPPATDLTPHLEAFNEAVADLARISDDYYVAQFEPRKDIYLGGTV